MPQCRRGRHKHGKRTQGPDDEAEGGRECEMSASRITTSGRADVFPFDVFLAAWLPRRPSAPVSPSFVLNGPESALQKPQNGPICTYGLEKAPSVASTDQPIGTPRFPQLKPPTIQHGRRLFSCVGWSIDPSRVTLGLKRPTTTASHQDSRRVHLCPSR